MPFEFGDCSFGGKIGEGGPSAQPISTCGTDALLQSPWTQSRVTSMFMWAPRTHLVGVCIVTA